MPLNQPYPMAKRSEGGFANALLGLAGRELNPTLPDAQQVPMEALIAAMEGARNVDPDRMRILRKMIEGRSADDAARGPGPQQPEATGKTSAERTGLSRYNPFGILSDVLGGN